jgi:hypothetical protein
MRPDSPTRARIMDASTRRVMRAYYRRPYRWPLHMLALALHRFLKAARDLLKYGCFDA